MVSPGFMARQLRFLLPLICRFALFLSRLGPFSRDLILIFVKFSRPTTSGGSCFGVCYPCFFFLASWWDGCASAGSRPEFLVLKLPLRSFRSSWQVFSVWLLPGR